MIVIIVLGGTIVSCILITAWVTSCTRSKLPNDPPPPMPSDITMQKPETVGGPWCKFCGREVRVLTSHRGKRFFECPKCGLLNIRVVGKIK